MALVQLDFFEKDTISEIKSRMHAVEVSATKCRRKQFAEIGEIKKLMLDLASRLTIIEKNICLMK